MINMYRLGCNAYSNNVTLAAHCRICVFFGVHQQIMLVAGRFFVSFTHPCSAMSKRKRARERGKEIAERLGVCRIPLVVDGCTVCGPLLACVCVCVCVQQSAIVRSFSSILLPLLLPEWPEQGWNKETRPATSVIHCCAPNIFNNTRVVRACVASYSWRHHEGFSFCSHKIQVIYIISKHTWC